MHEAAMETYRQAVTLSAELVKSSMWVGNGTITSIPDEQLRPGQDYSKQRKDCKNSIFPKLRST